MLTGSTAGPNLTQISASGMACPIGRTGTVTPCPNQPDPIEPLGKIRPFALRLTATVGPRIAPSERCSAEAPAGSVSPAWHMVRPAPDPIKYSLGIELACDTRRGERAMVSHKERPRFDKAMPAHVTLRVLDDVPSLRSSRRFAVIRRCFAAARGRHGVKLVEFTVMGNHLHLIVEADSNGALSRGMQGFAISAAKRLNRELRRKRGDVFAYRYHATEITSPTQARNAISYILNNWRHHRAAWRYGHRHLAMRADLAAIAAARRE